jgi:ornithine lipid ester-linked acyl 2-hydroxylase
LSVLSVPIRFVLRFTYRVTWLVERALLRYSAVPCTPFLDTQELQWTSVLERSWRTIYDELQGVVNNPDSIRPTSDIFTDAVAIAESEQWQSYFLKIYGRWASDNCSRCPSTVALLREIPSLSTAFFSILEPHSAIKEHRGPWRGQLRYHLGLEIPSEGEGCFLTVGSSQQLWRQGQGLLFDDGFRHSVVNNTSERRIVLFATVARPFREPVDSANRTLLWAFGYSPMVWPTRFRQARWTRRNKASKQNRATFLTQRQ